MRTSEGTFEKFPCVCFSLLRAQEPAEARAGNRHISYVVSSFKEVTDIFKQIIGFPTLFSLIIMCIYISLLVNLLINYSIFILLWTVSFQSSHRHFYLVGPMGIFSVLSFAKHIIPLSLRFCLFVE